MYYLFAFIFGSLIGSFLGVVSERLVQGRSIFWGRSICDKCGKTLKWYELIPIVSFLVLKGKCSKCRKKIGLKVLFIEVLTGLLTMSALLYFYTHNLTVVDGIIFLLIIYTFIVIFFIDLKFGIIPDILTLIILVLVSSRIYFISGPVVPNLISALGALLFFLSLFLITKGKGMGFGDVKLSFVLGLLLSYPLIVVSLYLSFLTGAAVSIILVILKKKSFRGGIIPFGPFLVFGTVITLFFDKWLVDIFQHFF